ncbi:ESX secretion-associated protein EspG [Actinokineospora sp.]|uniref:ESX secretion-associated protein EspG n=1 Tax=Actinokineospora sp. TaxID=1872133 RepID=UPI0040380D74
MSKIELSVHTLYRLVRQHNLGEPHTVFTGGERYFSPRFRQETDARSRRELDAAGVNTPRGVDEEFLGLLSVIQRAAVEYYGWLHDAEGPYSVLAAAAGRSAALAQRIDDKVSIERIDPAKVLDSFVYRLPNVPASRGEPISVPAADLRPQPRADGFSMSRPRSARPPAARRLEALMRAPRVGGGRLYTARRDHRGKRVRAADWVSVIDVPDGRWAVYQAPGRGERSVTAVPGTPQLIGRRLAELHQAIA